MCGLDGLFGQSLSKYSDQPHALISEELLSWLRKATYEVKRSLTNKDDYQNQTKDIHNFSAKSLKDWVLLVKHLGKMDLLVKLKWRKEEG